MNYHLMIDDKFIDGFIGDMEAAVPGGNVYIFTFDPPPKYVTSDDGVHAPYGSTKFREVTSQISPGDRVLVHWLDDDAARFIIDLPKSVEVGAFFWGGDFIDDPFYCFKRSWLGPLSLRLYETKLEYPIMSTVNPVTIFQRIRHRLFEYRKVQHERAELKRRAVSRLDRLFHWSMLDHEYVERLYQTAIEPTYFFYDVGLQDEVVKLRRPYTSRGARLRIWLGNSATITNNHLEALAILGPHRHRDIEIICPLSYGNLAYGNVIRRHGERLFGSRFRVLNEFLNREAYYGLMEDADVVIMNHYRSQAAGNIWAFLKMGKKIFMNSSSTLFKLLVDSRIEIFDFPASGVSFEDLSAPLRPGVPESNYARIQSLFSEERKRASLQLLR